MTTYKLKDNTAIDIVENKVIISHAMEGRVFLGNLPIYNIVLHLKKGIDEQSLIEILNNQDAKVDRNIIVINVREIIQQLINNNLVIVNET